MLLSHPLVCLFKPLPFMYMTDPCDHDPTAKNERPSHKARTKAEIFFLPFVDFSLDAECRR